MRLVRYNPNRAAERISRDFEGLFDSFFGVPSVRVSGKGDFSPRVDIVENEDNMTVVAEVPGMKKDAIKVLVEDGVLTISGERHVDKEEKKDNRILSEVSHGSFSRSFTLPDYLDTEHIKADYKDGMLSVVLPKQEKARPKEIKVEIN